jgi:DNA-binding CsgD family transcriptional regulator
MAVRAEPGLPLTARQLEVALLATNGLRNVDIARLLCVSTRTVEAHMRTVFAKAGVSNRVQLANWLIAQGDPGRPGTEP